MRRAAQAQATPACAASLFPRSPADDAFGVAGRNARSSAARAIMPSGGTAPWGSLAGILEAFGGLFLLVGLLTRPVAFLLSGEMAVACFSAHAPQGFWPVLNQGSPAALYCFLFLYRAPGAGPWSFDALLRRRGEASLAQPHGPDRAGP